MLSQGMKTAWVPRIVWITHSSSISAKPADLRQLSLFCTGQDPGQRLFTEPEMSPTLMAIQAHVQRSEQLITHLDGTRASLDETPGSNPKHTKVYFNDMTSSDLNPLSDKFGIMPIFAPMTSAMLEGRILEKMPQFVVALMCQAQWKRCSRLPQPCVWVNLPHQRKRVYQFMLWILR